jgi:hypothetical protein
MKYTLLIKPSAKAAIEDKVYYYESLREGLGLVF